MKKFAKILSIVAILAVVAAMSIGFTACNDNTTDGYSRHEGQVIRFAAPQGTPALAMLRLKTDNPKLDGTDMEYAVVSPSTIALEMGADKADVVIMPVNTGANQIRQGKDYKLVSVAVYGSLFMVGQKNGSNTLTFDDIKGKTVSCIGKAAVPGMVFRYVMKSNGIQLIESGAPTGNQVLVKYVPDATVAKSDIQNGTSQFAVVGEPAATTFKNALHLNAEMDMQKQYKAVNPSVNGDSYPQAGLFVRTALAYDTKFMAALFEALDNSKDWVEKNPDKVSAFADANLYAGATFPAASIPRCAIDCEKLDNEDKNEIIAFLKIVEPKDSETNATIDWSKLKDKLFV